MEHGLLRNPPQEGWTNAWLASIKAWISNQSETVAYLLPDMLFDMGDADPILLPQPMTYMRAFAHMRSWLKRNATSEPEGHAPPVPSMTTHSGKATLLTWANHLELPVELRAAQGHHKHEAPKGMVNLYGRDDTVCGLKTQKADLEGCA